MLTTVLNCNLPIGFPQDFLQGFPGVTSRKPSSMNILQNSSGSIDGIRRGNLGFFWNFPLRFLQKFFLRFLKNFHLGILQELFPGFLRKKSSKFCSYIPSIVFSEFPKEVPSGTRSAIHPATPSEILLKNLLGIPPRVPTRIFSEIYSWSFF